MDLDKVEEQLKKVPEGIKKAFFSPETAMKIEDIGKHNDLFLDQIDDLIEEVGLTMIGLKPQEQLINSVSHKLNIDEKKTKKIVAEINTEVLTKILTAARKSAENTATNSIPEQVMRAPQNQSDISAVEQAGGFSVEPSVDSEEKETGRGVTAADKNKILEGIENPKPVADVIPPNLPTGQLDPLVDRLLSGSISIPAEKIINKIPPKAPEQGKKKYEADPYHEPIA